MATIATSVTVIEGPIEGALALDQQLSAVRRRFPRAIIDRYLALVPHIRDRVLIAPGAAVIGDVRLGEDVSVWYGAVLRADLSAIIIGDRANIQDGTVMHVGDKSPCIVGAETVVGHRAVLHGCRVEEGCLIGMQATVLEDAVIGQGSIVGAGALVTQNTVIPPGSLVLGAPAKVVRSLDAEDEAFHRAVALKYVRLKENYRRDALRKDAG